MMNHGRRSGVDEEEGEAEVSDAKVLHANFARSPAVRRGEGEGWVESLGHGGFTGLDGYWNGRVLVMVSTWQEQAATESILWEGRQDSMQDSKFY